MRTTRERLFRTGILRRRAGGGFRYRYASGGRPTRDDLARVDRMRLPPAWRDVAISRSASARVQAIGRDAAGRWQYVYHAEHVRRRERSKFERLLRFGLAMPRLRRVVGRHLALPGLPREKVLACIARILSLAYVRPGSEAYAAQNGSYGIATLRRRHTQVRGATVVFDFPGKSGQRQQLTCRDARVARIVRELLALPGFEVFKYRNESGAWVDVKRQHINAYIKEHMGDGFSAKDFRTWAGTLICATALARGCPGGERSAAARKREVVAAVKETAAALGNTPAVCRGSYIAPALLDCYNAGEAMTVQPLTIEQLRRAPARAEQALLRLLRRRLNRNGAATPARLAA